MILVLSLIGWHVLWCRNKFIPYAEGKTTFPVLSWLLYMGTLVGICQMNESIHLTLGSVLLFCLPFNWKRK